MSFWGRIFGSADTIRSGTDAIIATGDALVFTKEEKADYWLKLLKAYEPFKLTQRLLALTVTVPFVMIWLLCAGMFVGGGLLSVEVLVSTSQTLGTMNNDTLGQPTAIILAFYFGGGALEGIVRARTGK